MGLVIVHEDAEVDLTRGRMRLEVVVRPVRHAHDLNPAQAVQQNLRIPAVSSIVGHLIFLMLPEAQLVRGYAHGQQKLIGPCHIVCQSLVGHNSPLHSLAEGHLLFCTRLLRGLGIELHLDVPHLAKARMGLVSGVDEYLRLGLGELSQANHTLAGRYLIPEGLADLNRREGQRVAEVAQKAREIYEHSLRGLRSQVAGHLVSWTDHGLEHEIELIDL
ncbi:Uncharacterised protein [uncultured archaeon]|nr:Uncharacterised protein [uncultured archaeon]